MKLTHEELAIVSQYEGNLRTAVRSRYLRHVGRSAIEKLVPIYNRATGYHVRVNDSCGACVLDFLQRLGALYFADVEELEAAKTVEQTSAVPETIPEEKKRGKRKKQ